MKSNKLMGYRDYLSAVDDEVFNQSQILASDAPAIRTILVGQIRKLEPIVMCESPVLRNLKQGKT